MNRVSKILLVIGVAFLYNNSYAQKNTWTIGLYTGVQGQMTTSSMEDVREVDRETGKHEYRDFSGFGATSTIHRISPAPPAELIVQYKITDCFSIASGVGYGLHRTQWKPTAYMNYMENIMGNFAYNNWSHRTTIQVPLILQYDIPLKNTGFSFFANMGVYFDFRIYSYGRSSFCPDTLVYYDDYDAKMYDVELTQDLDFYIYGVNFLLHAGLGFSYQFKSGLGISLSGTYNTGTRPTEHLTLDAKFKDSITGIVEEKWRCHVYNNNQNWNVLLGVTYTFKKKEN